MATSNPGPAASNPFLDLMAALSNRHGQIDIRLDRMSMTLPFAVGSIELNGTVSVSVHLRELSEKERTAHVARQVRALQA